MEMMKQIKAKWELAVSALILGNSLAIVAMFATKLGQYSLVLILVNLMVYLVVRVFEMESEIYPVPSKSARKVSLGFSGIYLVLFILHFLFPFI